MKNNEEFRKTVYDRAAEISNAAKIRKRNSFVMVFCLCIVFVFSFVMKNMQQKNGVVNSGESAYSETDKSSEGSNGISRTDDESKTVPSPMMGITDLMAGIENTNTDDFSLDDELLASTAEFYFDFVNKTAEKGENLVFSPASAQFALAMTANGAANNTLADMEKVLAGGKSITSLNRFMAAYADEISGDHLHIANSLWIGNGRVNVYEDFLKTNAAYYDAGAFYADFGDKETVNAINSWISEHTDGMINDMLKEIKEENIMFLVNAITFEAEWKKNAVSGVNEKASFKNYNGTTLKVTEFTYTGESKTLTLGNGTGVIMPYKDCNFSFVAILPDEGIDVYDYLASIDGGGFVNAIKSAENGANDINMPEFEIKSSLDLKAPLTDLGMGIAFSESNNADFTKLGVARGPISISSVNQDAVISVTRVGTKASAATIVGMEDECARQSVNFNRPFVYAIIDNATCLPVFIGVNANMD